MLVGFLLEQNYTDKKAVAPLQKFREKNDLKKDKEGPYILHFVTVAMIRRHILFFLLSGFHISGYIFHASAMSFFPI